MTTVNLTSRMTPDELAEHLTAIKTHAESGGFSDDTITRSRIVADSAVYLDLLFITETQPFAIRRSRELIADMRLRYGYGQLPDSK